MGQMIWQSTYSSQGAKILHLRLQNNKPWKPYTAFPQHSVPDYQVPKGSKGWATYQKLLKNGWELIPSDTKY